MSSLARQTATNPLIQRVRRHQGLTTLFQLGQPSADAGTPVQRSVASAGMPAVFVLGTIPEMPLQIAPEAVIDIGSGTVDQEVIGTEQSQTQISTGAVDALLSHQPPLTTTQRQVVAAMGAMPPIATNMQQAQPVAATMRPHSPQPAAQGLRSQTPAHSASNQSPQAIQRSGDARSEPTAPTAAPTVSTADDRTWSRLEAIMAAHRRQESAPAATPTRAQTGSPQPQRPANPAGSPPATPARQPAQTDVSSPAKTRSLSTEAQSALQRSVIPAAAGNAENDEITRPLAPVVEPQSHSNLPTEPDASATINKKVAEGLQTPRVAGQSTQRRETPQTRTEQLTVASAEQPIHRQLASSRHENKAVSPSQPHDPIAPVREGQAGVKQEIKQGSPTGIIQPTSASAVQPVDPAQSAADAMAPFVEAESSGLPNDQALPLQEAWPGVQQIIQRADSDDLDMRANEANAVQSDDINPVAFTERAEVSTAVRAALSYVETAQPTESAVHVIPPRRPRPRVQRSSTNKVADPVANPMPQAEATLDQATAKAEVNDDSLVDQASKSEYVPFIDGATLVETEIGALPEDLWRLIDEPVPSQPAQPEAIKKPVYSPITQAPSAVQAKRLATAQRAGLDNTSDAAVVGELFLTGEVRNEELQVDPVSSIMPDAHFSASSVVQTHEQQSNALNQVVTKNSVQDSHGLQRQPTAMSSDAIEPQAMAEQTEFDASRTNTTPANAASKLSALAPRQEGVVVAAKNQTTSVLQRQPDETLPEQSVPERSVPVDQVDPLETAATSKVDTDELAREVYSKLRRRLAVEQERMGF